MVNKINKLSKEGWEDIYLVQGKTLAEIADIFGVHLTTIYNRLKKFGIKRRACGHKLLYNITKPELENMYRNKKMSFVDISKHYGCTESSIRRRIQDFDIEINTRPGDVLTEEFLRSYVDNGKPIRRIEEDTGILYPTIYRYLHKFGFKIGDSSKRKLVGQEEDVITDYLCGLHTTQVAKKYGVSTPVITRILETNGISRRSSNCFRKKVPEIDELCKLYFEDLLSLTEIASLSGCTKAAVYLQFKKHKIALRSKSESLEGPSNGMYGKNHTDNAKDKMSKAFVDEMRSVHTVCEEVINTPYQGVKRVRSSWEAAVARYFEENNIKYLYESERISLPSGSSYLPDFFLLVDKKYIEVKGWFRDKDKIKVAEFRGMGFNIEVWDRTKLESLGVINSAGVAIM